MTVGVAVNSMKPNDYVTAPTSTDGDEMQQFSQEDLLLLFRGYPPNRSKSTSKQSAVLSEVEFTV